jgi:hypothetical protein
MNSIASAPAPAAEPLADPCEQAVMDWMRLRLAALRQFSGINALSVHATWYPHSEEIDVLWILHSGGKCVVDQPSIAEGVRALRVKLAERGTQEARA